MEYLNSIFRATFIVKLNGNCAYVNVWEFPYVIPIAFKLLCFPRRVPLKKLLVCETIKTALVYPLEVEPFPLSQFFIYPQQVSNLQYNRLPL